MPCRGAGRPRQGCGPRTILRGFYMGGEVVPEDKDACGSAVQAADQTEDWANVQSERGLLPMNMASAELEASITERVGVLREIATEAGPIN